MKLFSSKKRVAAIGALTAVTLVGGGMAYGYWTDSGEGGTTVTAGTSAGYTVTFGATTGGDLSPDGPTNSTSVTVANEGTGAQQISSVLVSVANVDGSAWTDNSCSAADFSVNSETAGNAAEALPAPVTLAPKGSTGEATSALPVTIQMIDTGADQEDCKGVTVPLYAYAS